MLSYDVEEGSGKRSRSSDSESKSMTRPIGRRARGIAEGETSTPSSSCSSFACKALAHDLTYYGWILAPLYMLLITCWVPHNIPHFLPLTLVNLLSFLITAASFIKFYLTGPYVGFLLTVVAPVDTAHRCV